MHTVLDFSFIFLSKLWRRVLQTNGSSKNRWSVTSKCHTLGTPNKKNKPHQHETKIKKPPQELKNPNYHHEKVNFFVFFNLIRHTLEKKHCSHHSAKCINYNKKDSTSRLHIIQISEQCMPQIKEKA